MGCKRLLSRLMGVKLLAVTIFYEHFRARRGTVIPYVRGVEISFVEFYCTECTRDKRWRYTRRSAYIYDAHSSQSRMIALRIYVRSSGCFN